MTARGVFGTLRLLVAVVGVVALVARFQYGLGFSAFASANFFGYLTVQSNMVAVVANVLCGVAALRRPVDPAWMPGLRLCVTTFLIVAGIVFALLASQAEARGYRLDVPWSDQLLHFWIPGYLLLDWLLAPGERHVRRAVLWIVIGYPLGWGVVTLVRGAIIGWYPYFFLDPAQVSGPLEFIAYSAAAIGLFTAVAIGLMLLPLPRLVHRVLEAALRPLRRAVPLLLTPRRRTAEDSPGTP